MKTHDKNISRRGFFKRAAVGGVAITGTAGLAKLTISALPNQNPQELYDNDVRRGNRVLAQRTYVEMTDQEKEEMVQELITRHKAQV